MKVERQKRRRFFFQLSLIAVSTDISSSLVSVCPRTVPLHHSTAQVTLPRTLQYPAMSTAAAPASTSSANTFASMTLHEVLEDLSRSVSRYSYTVGSMSNESVSAGLSSTCHPKNWAASSVSVSKSNRGVCPCQSFLCRVYIQLPSYSHWYYEDFVRPQNPSLPSFTLRKFSERVFRECELLRYVVASFFLGGGVHAKEFMCVGTMTLRLPTSTSYDTKVAYPYAAQSCSTLRWTR
jgi:hypothetical protein